MGKKSTAVLLKNFRFKVFEGADLTKEFLSCNEISGGFDAKMKYTTYREGSSSSLYPIQVPGLAEASNITFKYGISRNMEEVVDWVYKYIKNGSVDCKPNLTIILYKDDGKSIGAKWEITNMHPVSYKGPSFNALNSEVAFEELEICHEGLERVDIPVTLL